MLIHNAVITGSLTYNGVDISDITGSEGSISALNSFSASMLSYTASNNLASASFSTRVTNLESTASVLTTASASFSIVSQSYASASGSLSTRVTNTESTGSSLVTASGSFSTRVTDLESTGSSLVAASASFSTRTTNLEATASVLTTASASFSVVSASFASTSGSLSTRVTTLESASSSFAQQSGSNSVRLTNLESTASVLTNASASFSVVSSSFSSTSQSLSNRVTIVEGSYATTGSNVFVGNQGLTSTSNAISFTSTGSLYIDGGARITKDMYVSGTAFFNNVTIYGTQSVNYITSSQLNIGTNIITVNTDTPTVRYGGLAVYDSGSTGLTGSILWDSENNHWIYTNPSASTYSGGMLISGPRASARGCEVGTTSCAVMMGQGGDHITSSAIFHYGNATCIPNTLIGSTICTTMANASCIGVGTTTPCSTLHIATGPNTDGIFLGRIAACTNKHAIFLSADQSVGAYIAGGTNPDGTATQADGAGRLILQGGQTEGFQFQTSCVAGGAAQSWQTRLKIFNSGIACFSNTVCVPNFYMNGGIINQTSGDLSFWVPNVGQAVTITQNTGRVGIGTTGPGYKLQVNGSISGTVAVFAYNGAFAGTCESNIGLRFYCGDNDTDIPQIKLRAYGTSNYTGNFAIDVMCGGTYPNTYAERFTIQGTTGNVGIGITNPAYTFDVNKSVAADFVARIANSSATGYGLYIQANDNTKAGIRIANSSGGTAIDLFGSGVACFSSNVCAPVFLASGCVSVGTTSPRAILAVEQDYTTTAEFGSHGQFTISGKTNAEKRLDIGFNTSTDVGFIQAMINGTSYNNLLLNARGGNVGINCTSPGYNLDVCGFVNINAEADTRQGTVQSLRVSSNIGNAAVTINSCSNNHYGYLNFAQGCVTKFEIGISSCSDSNFPSSLYINNNVQVGAANAAIRISSTGITSFQCQVCSPSFRGGSSTNTTNALSAQNASLAEATIYSFNHCAAGWSVYSAQGLNYFAGNVGINEVTPLSPLHFSRQTTWGSTDNRIININNTGTGGNINTDHNMGSITWYSGNSTPTAEIAAYRNTPAAGNQIELRFYTAASGIPGERIRITNTGATVIRPNCISLSDVADRTLLLGSRPGSSDIVSLGFDPGGTWKAGFDYKGSDGQLEWWTNNGSWCRRIMYTPTGIACFSNTVCTPMLLASGCVGIGTTNPIANGLMIEKTGNHLFLRASSAAAGKYWNFDVTADNQLYIINNAGTQYLTILDGGNVGIGITSPNASSPLHIKMCSNSNQDGLRVQAVCSGGAGSQPGIAFASTADSKRWAVSIDNTSDIFQITNASGLNALEITQTRIASFACQICATSGVKFGNGSSTLNYYEQGTWTPRLKNGSFTTNVGGPNAGWYIRVGNIVTVGGTLSWTGGSGAQDGNSLQIACLPFSSNSTENHRSVGQFGAPAIDSIGFKNACAQMTLVVDPGASFIYIIENYQNGTYLTYTHSPCANTSGTIYGFQATYQI